MLWYPWCVFCWHCCFRGFLYFFTLHLLLYDENHVKFIFIFEGRPVYWIVDWTENVTTLLATPGVCVHLVKPASNAKRVSILNILLSFAFFLFHFLMGNISERPVRVVFFLPKKKIIANRCSVRRPSEQTKFVSC